MVELFTEFTKGGLALKLNITPNKKLWQDGGIVNAQGEQSQII